MAISDKLTYLNDTKTQLKDMINYGLDTGEKITSETTFRNYVKSLFDAFIKTMTYPDVLYNNLPKVTGEGTSVTLNDTVYAPMRVELSPSELEQATTSISEGDEYDSPSPEHPQEIHTVSGENEVGIEGNLFSSEWEQGEIRSTGVEASTNSVIRTKGYIPVIPNQHYAINRDITGGYIRVRCYDKDKTYLGSGTNYITLISGSSGSNPMSANDKQCVIAPKENVYYLRFNDLSNNLSTKYMMVKGDTPLDYQPYTKQSLPLSLGDLEYCKIGDYEDEFYKATESDTGLTAGKWYLKKNIGKVVLDGSENWNVYTTTDSQGNTYGYYVILSLQPLQETSAKKFALSNYFIQQRRAEVSINDAQGIYLGSGVNLFIKIAQSLISGGTLANFKVWLSNNTPNVYYVLATPTYTLLSDTLQTQLDNLSKAISYQDQTNVSQTNNDLPFILDVTALKELTTEEI